MNQNVTNTRRGPFAAQSAAALSACLILVFCLSAFTPPDPPKGCSGRCKSSSMTPKAIPTPSVTPLRTGPDSAPVKANIRVIIHPVEAAHSEAVHTGATVRPGAIIVPDKDKKTKQPAQDRTPAGAEKGEMPASSPVMVTLFV